MAEALSYFPFPSLVVFFLLGSFLFVPVLSPALPASHPPPRGWDMGSPQKPFFSAEEGSQSMLLWSGEALPRLARLPTGSLQLPTSQKGWARGGAKVSEGGGWAGGALELVARVDQMGQVTPQVRR